MSKISNKFYIVAFFILFAISTAILLIASTAKTPLPAWGGYLDVGIVVLIVINGFAIYWLNKNKPSYYLSHQAALYLFPILLLGMWVYRNRFDFNILLPGLAWRVFFFLSILPYGLNLWKGETAQ
jgi:hypothetical protein